MRASIATRGTLLLFLLLASGTAAAQPDPSEVAANLARLREGTVEERIGAARWLGLRGVDEAEDVLRDVYRHARDPRLVAAVRQALELLQSPGLVTLVDPGDVLEGLASPDPEKRVEALRHVVYQGLEEAMPQLLSLLEDPDERLRLMSLWALGTVDPDRDQQAAALRLLEDPAGSVRRQALLYLEGHVGVDLVPPVVDRVADPSEEVRDLAVRLLDRGDLREAAVAETVARLDGTDAPALVAWMDALARWRGDEDLPSAAERRALHRLLSSPDEEVAVAAASLLAPAGERAAIRRLRRALDHEDPALRLRAVRALAGLEVPPGTVEVAALLDDPDADVRHAAFDLVPAVDPVDARAMLRSALARTSAPDSGLGGDEVLVGRALQALAEVGEAEDVRTILTLAEASGSAFVRISALSGLGPLERRAGTRECLDWVRRLLADPDVDPSVASAALFPLWDLGDESFLPLLAARLRATEGYEATAGELTATISMLLGRKLHGPTFLAEPRP